MTYVTTVLAIAAFTVGLWIFGVVAVAQRIVAAGRSATAVIRSHSLDDDTKEREVQRASVALLRDFVSILVRGICVVTLSLVPLFVFDFAGLVSLEQSLDALATWQAIVIATVAMLGVGLLRRRH